MICFHCGQPGHIISTCTSSSMPQSLAGKEAWHRFIDRRTKLNAKHGRKRKDPLQQVLKWMSDADTLIIDDQNKDAKECVRAKDPIAILVSEAKNAKASFADDTITQKWKDRHNAKRNNLDRAFHRSFNQRIEIIRRGLISRLNVTPERLAASTWQSELNRAVVLGRPANFAAQNEYDDAQYQGVDGDNDPGRCIEVYAVEKLNSRCRYLYHLLFGNDHLTSKVRSLLLPLPATEQVDESTIQHDTPDVNIVSLGAGPGFDHIAMCLVSQFLYDIQPNNRLLRRRQINTKMYDLFDRDWEPIMSMLGESCHEGLNHPLYRNEHHDGCDDNNASCINNNGCNMTMSHGDLRIRLNATIHANDLACAIQTADIICAQFVLHENASCILKQDEDTIVGAMKDILEQAPVGTIMICTDSANFLFPALKRTATKLGWTYLGDEERREKRETIAHLGPKSYVILEKAYMKNDLG